MGRRLAILRRGNPFAFAGVIRYYAITQGLFYYGTGMDMKAETYFLGAGYSLKIVVNFDFECISL